jgi:NAD(P)-dependent dehydrogenase (short-subunit alcohol dehydrogenase family)
MDDFTGKVVLVTGAGQACGRALAEDFGRRGAKVVVNDVDGTSGTETVRRITEAGGEARFEPADVSIDSDVARLIDATVATLDGWTVR